jgi:hypothetical protein
LPRDDELRCWRKLRGKTAPERVQEDRLDDWQDVVTAVRAINDVVLSFPDVDVPGAVRGPR